MSDEIQIDKLHADDPLIGTVLEEKLELKSVLGKGAYGTVYKAFHRLLDQFVAVKVLHADPLDSERAKQRFRNEANLLSSFAHENIVRFHSFGKMPDGRIYMVLEYLEGKTLAELLSESRTLDFKRATEFFIQICSGLGYAHSRDIIHRDLKPANIMICQTKDGEAAKLLDFGIFKEIQNPKQNLTQTGTFVGSVNYMSPEQCKAQALDERSDLYSFGCLAYETLAGQPPMQDSNDMLIMSNHVNKEIDSVPAKIPKELEKIILRCLKKIPAERYVSADELLDTLKSCRELSPQQPAGAGGKKLLWLALIIIPLCLIGIKLTKPSAEKASESVELHNESTIAINKFLPHALIDDYATCQSAEDWLRTFEGKTELDTKNVTTLYSRCQLFRATNEKKPSPVDPNRIRKLFKIHRSLQSYTDKWAGMQALYAIFLESSGYSQEAIEALELLLKKNPDDDDSCCRGLTMSLEAAVRLKKPSDQEKIIQLFRSYASKTSKLRVQVSCTQNETRLLLIKRDLPKAKEKARETYSKLKEMAEQNIGIDPSTLSALCTQLAELGEPNLLIDLTESCYRLAYPGHSYYDPTQTMESNISIIKLANAKAYWKLGKFDEAIKICRFSKEQFFNTRAADTYCDYFEVVMLESMYSLAKRKEIANETKAITDEASAYLLRVKDTVEERYSTSLAVLAKALNNLHISTQPVLDKLRAVSQKQPKPTGVPPNLTSVQNSSSIETQHKAPVHWVPSDDILNDEQLNTAIAWLDQRSRIPTTPISDLSRTLYKCIQVTQGRKSILEAPYTERILNRLKQPSRRSASAQYLKGQSDLVLILVYQEKDDEVLNYLSILSNDKGELKQRNVYRETATAAIEITQAHQRLPEARALVRQFKEAAALQSDKLSAALACLAEACLCLSEGNKSAAQKHLIESHKQLLAVRQDGVQISETQIYKFCTLAESLSIDPKLILQLQLACYGELAPRKQHLNSNEFTVGLVACRALLQTGKYQEAIEIAGKIRDCQLDEAYKIADSDLAEEFVLKAMKQKGKSKTEINKELAVYLERVKKNSESNYSNSAVKLKQAGFPM